MLILSILSGVLAIPEIFIFVNLKNSANYFNLASIFIVKSMISILLVIMQNFILFKFEEKFIKVLIIRLLKYKVNISQGNIIKILTINLNSVFHSFGSGLIALANDIFFLIFYFIGLVYITTESLKIELSIKILIVILIIIGTILLLIYIPIRILRIASKNLNFGLNIYSNKIKDLADFITNKVNVIDEKKFIRSEISESFKYTNKFQIIQFSIMESFKNYSELICGFFILIYIYEGSDILKVIAVIGVIIFRLLPISIKIISNINRILSGIPALRQLNEF